MKKDKYISFKVTTELNSVFFVTFFEIDPEGKQRRMVVDITAGEYETQEILPLPRFFFKSYCKKWIKRKFGFLIEEYKDKFSGCGFLIEEYKDKFSIY